MNFTRQKMLNRLYRARDGKGRSMRDDGGCSYEACAIGCQNGFPDSARVSRSLIGTLLESSPKVRNWLGVKETDEDDLNFLRHFQWLHDSEDNWSADGKRLLKRAVDAFAKKWKIKSPWRAKVVAA